MRGGADPDLRFLAARAGDMPPEGTAELAGIPLPAGERLDGFWCAKPGDHDVLDLASRYAGVFAETGLWPLIWDYPEEPAGYTDEFGRGPVDDSYDAAWLIDSGWRHKPPQPEWVAPLGTSFPGLADGTARAGTPFDPFTVLRERPNAVEDPGGARLLLVPCTRPAHAVAAMGADCGELLGTVAAVVLASWEERFGAVVTALTPGSTTLVLEAPPTTVEHALRVAAEHYGVVLGEDAGRAGALVERANDLVDERIWLIWWYA